jgi:hypothetical protein
LRAVDASSAQAGCAKVDNVNNGISIPASRPARALNIYPSSNYFFSPIDRTSFEPFTRFFQSARRWRRDGKRFIVRADEKLTAFMELEAGAKVA